MLNQFSRTQLLLGKESIGRLQNARVAVFGIDGVGGYVDQLPFTLYLSARYEAQMHRTQGYSRKRGICAVHCRTIDRRRGRERPDDYEDREE
ncbi:MAG: hypothetical protein IJJ76_07815 [Ruminococcus sp.]|nr:hypothetical protein [Ruminococcus sp.]